MAGTQLAGPFGRDRQDQVLCGGHFGITGLINGRIRIGVFIRAFGIIRQTRHRTAHLEIGRAFVAGGVEVADDRHGNNRILARQPDAAHTDRGTRVEHAHISGRETDRPARVGNQHHIVII